MSGDTVAFNDGGHITSDYLINTCITPPLHPSLFSGVQKMLIRGMGKGLKVQMLYVLCYM